MGVEERQEKFQWENGHKSHLQKFAIFVLKLINFKLISTHMNYLGHREREKEKIGGGAGSCSTEGN